MYAKDTLFGSDVLMISPFETHQDQFSSMQVRVMFFKYIEPISLIFNIFCNYYKPFMGI